MSKFLKALEQAERERAHREQDHRRDQGLTEVALPAPAAPPGDRLPAWTPVTAGLEPERAREPAEEPPEGVEEHLVSLLTPTAFEAEQYRGLRHTVEQLHKTARLSIVAVSSPVAGDGKTMTAINLAGALAQAPEARVLLVEADLRRPSVAHRLGLGDSDGCGLVDAILGPGFALDNVVRRRSPFNLSVLPAGRRLTAPYELLKSARLGELLEEARRRFDYIVVDTPPLVPIPDCRVIGKWVDGFLVIVAAHKTPRRLVEEALKVVEPAKIVGLVFNKDDRLLSGYYGYYYTYRQPLDGDRVAWWGRVGKRLGRSSRRRR